jgi:hypothetical protein
VKLEMEMIDTVEALFLLYALFILLFIFIARWLVLRRAAHLIGRWCDKSGLKLVSKQLDTWARLRGPFALTSSWYRPVYRVRVQEVSGKTRKASLSFGHWLSGVFSGQVRVVWDVSNDDSGKVENSSASGLS